MKKKKMKRMKTNFYFPACLSPVVRRGANKEETIMKMIKAEILWEMAGNYYKKNVDLLKSDTDAAINGDKRKMRQVCEQIYCSHPKRIKQQNFRLVSIEGFKACQVIMKEYHSV
jgi:hypothetical protein